MKKNENELYKQTNEELINLAYRAARLAAWLGGLLVLASTLLDFFINPGYIITFGLIRLLICFGCFFVFFLTQKELLKNNGGLLFSAVAIICGSGLSVIIHYLGYNDPYYAGMNLVYLGIMLAPFTFSSTALLCLSVYAMYLIPVFFLHHGNIDLDAFVNNNIFQLETIAIVAVANHFDLKNKKTSIFNRLKSEKQAKELEVLDQFKREVIANITHEIKTPLSIIRNNIELAQEKLTNEEGNDLLGVADNAAMQLNKHVDRIINISRVDDPDVKLELYNYDYTRLVRDTFDLLKSTADKKAISFSLRVGDESLVINADIVRIEEVLNNLFQNALKFTPKGGAVIVTITSDGQNVYTEVADTGVGIEKEKIEKIFDRMYQADDVLSKQFDGMGLGLYICKKNIELHSGKISVVSEKDKGTSFRFSLPLHIDQDAEVKNKPYTGMERRQSPTRRTGYDRRMVQRQKHYERAHALTIEDVAGQTYAENVKSYENKHPDRSTILLVEDNAGMMKVIAESLYKEYNLILAYDGAGALKKLEEYGYQIALVLSDIMMPKMSGFDFCRKVMEHEEWKHIPLIFITALMEEHDQLQGFNLGATDYVTKPYNTKILREKVGHWIARRKYETILKEMSETLEERMKQQARVKDIILHEIKNPMQILEGANWLMEQLNNDSTIDNNSEYGEKARKYLDMINQGTHALRSVIEVSRALDVSVIAEKKPMELTSIILSSLDQVQHHLRGIHVEIDIPSLQNKIVECDKKMMHQVFINIVRNAAEAIKEAKEQKVLKSKGVIKVYANMENDSTVGIKIVDNGIGMTQETVNRLFQFKFTTKKDGTGIGLNFTKMICKLHGGGIEAESELNSHSVFTIYLGARMKEVPIDYSSISGDSEES